MEFSSSTNTGKTSALPDGQERRRYFRLNDRLGVRLKSLDASGLETELVAEGSDERKKMQQSDWQRQFAHWDIVLNEIEPELNHSALGAAIKALRHQIQLLSEPFMVQDRVQKEYLDENHDVKEVNISACGLALYHRPGVKEGTAVSVSLSLGENELPVFAEARVIAVEPRCSDLDYVRLDFNAIDSESQERLIQYLVRRQSEQLREKTKK